MILLLNQPCIDQFIVSLSFKHNLVVMSYRYDSSLCIIEFNLTKVFYGTLQCERLETEMPSIFFNCPVSIPFAKRNFGIIRKRIKNSFEYEYDESNQTATQSTIGAIPSSFTDGRSIFWCCGSIMYLYSDRCSIPFILNCRILQGQKNPSMPGLYRYGTSRLINRLTCN